MNYIYILFISTLKYILSELKVTLFIYIYIYTINIKGFQAI